MKKTVYLIIMFLTLISISLSAQKRRGDRNLKADTISIDSLQYELTVIDPGFETWLVTQPPKEFHSQLFYEQKNHQYVTEWNQRYLSAKGRGGYDSYIDYQFGIDYGLDLNYKLYYYFRYFEMTNRVRLISSGR
jgi:hypothetical protein